MIQTLARHQRRVALSIFFLFYLELVGPNIRSAFAAPARHIPYYGNKIYKSATHFLSSGQELVTSLQRLRQPLYQQKTKVIWEEKSNHIDGIGGPGQPEMTGFKSVNSNDMVDLFTGDFSYNIPLMDVGGYPVNIHYSSGISMDQEASWVGLGWNLNPGTISRSVRGLPDDFNGNDSISKTQSIKPNKTTGVTVEPDFELGGMIINNWDINFKDSPTVKVGVGARLGVFYNTYNGWGTEFGLNASIRSGKKAAGTLSGGLSLNSNTQSGVSINPSISYALNSKDEAEKGNISLGLGTGFNTRSGLSSLQLSGNTRTELTHLKTLQTHDHWLSVPIGSISFAKPSYTPSISMPYTTSSFTFRGKIGTTTWSAHPSISVEGYTTVQEIKEEDKEQVKPAVGYLYYSRANGNTNTLMDFNRDRDVAYIPGKTPNIAIPQFTYDVYSITGEGTGGMFRPYRGDLGFVRDHFMQTKSGSDKLSIDLGFGNLFHGGVDFALTRAFTENNPWVKENDLATYLKFKESDTTFEAVYFRNPGEKTTNSQDYYNSIGGDELIRARLLGKRANVRGGSSFMKFRNGKYSGEVSVTGPIVKQQRDKRTQVISYLTAQDAAIVGLEKQIVSYKENSIPGISCEDTATVIPRYDGSIRKKHHISQITVLNGDGRRYVYGIPAYNLVQKDVTFSINKETDANDINKGLADYVPGTDNSTSNNKGKEGYFSKDSVPAHAHSFLLTAIVSPDYVDLKDDGITEDDMGDAVKFNYTRVYGDSGNYFKWRTPTDLNKVNYNEGLKSDSRDDKGTYIYGEKEVWYLNSIESKTMIAVFTVANDRLDVYSVSGENGGIDNTRSTRRLKQIDLYVKADLAKHGKNAKPVKTVHFAYSYSLCKGIAGNPDVGKLTLDSIWFSYNGNEKGKLNPYVFRYNSFNPGYNPTHYDRWGNYKDPAANPKPGMLNSDYPYAEQDSTLAAKYAAAWTLSEILLPSGGRIKVTYESDDYGFVQHKRATQFFKVAGVAFSQQGSPGEKLYENDIDAMYVFVKSPVPIHDKQDIYQKFLEGNRYIYFKLAVRVPEDKWGGGVEYVPVYAEVDDYGKGSQNKFWIKLKLIDGQSPFSRSALEFLRLNLPSKAFPDSEPGEDANVWDVIKMMGTSIKNLATATTSYNTQARTAGYCKTIDTTQSFVRLNSPLYKKYGGGLRVKKVEVYDNWDQMTGQKESVYGQEYNYTTTENINGKDVVISSGVASYEPMIGAEENPFRSPLPYAERIAPGAPVNHLFVEEPMGEAYYPSASVGYSKVRIRTINAKAKSANGWQETEFFTTRDFPTMVENTIIDEDAKEHYQPKIANFLRVDAKNFVTLSQGFKVELNDMNGKVKAQASYAETDPNTPISYVRNFYKVDNDSAYNKHLNNNVWTVDSVNGRVNFNGVVGRDIEVMVDFREQLSETISGDFGVNVDVAIAGVFPWILPSKIPMPQRDRMRYRSVAVVKIIQRYGILDSVVAMDKGSLVYTKNLLYDGETGEVVLSRTNNEFNDPIYNFSYPAHWAYSGMGMAYQNVDAIFRDLKMVNGVLYYGGQSTTPYPVERFFESGDEVLMMAIPKTMQTGANCLQYEIEDPNTPKPKPIPTRAWIIDASKGKEGDEGLYFIDGNGYPLTLQVESMRILRSGHRNLLDASVGSIMCVSNPIKDLGEDGVRLVFDSSTRVINTSAVTYKDMWKMEKFAYPRDTVFKVYHNYTKVLTPTVANMRWDVSPNVTSVVRNARNVAAAYDFIGSTLLCKSRRRYVKSILSFDFSEIPIDAIVNSASISFTGRKPTDVWEQYQSPCSKKKGMDWAAATNYYGGHSNAFLRRITAPWSESTPYESLQSTTLNEVKLSHTVYNSVSCGPLVQGMIDNAQYELVMSIEKTEADDNDDSEVNYLNFCAKNEHNINCITSNDNNGAMVCDCTAPVLVINYTSLDDSVAYRCSVLGEDSVVNPYRLGLLGNWRMDRAYTFYHDRKESDASITTTDIRRDGELKAFSTFWKFTNTVLKAEPDTTKWVWNSASSLYSKKGFEIENYDPLGRFNAGLYGYNGTLPIATAQNSRYREILYDGFEDYGYQSEVCTFCVTPRDIDFLANTTGAVVTDTVSHTGLYSLKVLAGKQASISAPLVSASEADSDIQLSSQIDTSVNLGSVYPNTGVGLDLDIYGFSTANPCPQIPGPTTTHVSLNDVPINNAWGNGSPASNICRNWFTVDWEGYIKVPVTDNYTFYGISDHAFQVRIGQTPVLEALTPNVQTRGATLQLQAGQLYTIKARYTHGVGSNSYVKLSWSKGANPNVIEPIGSEFFYDLRKPETTVVSNVPTNCVSASPVQPENFIRPTFSPMLGSRLVVSAWVRIDGNDCNTAPALDSVIKVVVHDPSLKDQDFYLRKTGVRIEGWQRYESVVPVFEGTSMSIAAVAPDDRNIFVDDIRVQPFSSAMKSYAYNPENLRLMAELDENNYATFYEYDDDGSLIRVKKETERGIMTIRESRSALLKNN